MAERPPNTPSQSEGLKQWSAGLARHEEIVTARKKTARQAAGQAERDGTDDMVLRALRRGPATVDQLVGRIMLSKSWAGKSLRRLEASGDAVRTPGSGREPDVWSVDRC